MAKWRKGRIYNPEDGKSYKSQISLDKDDPNVLRKGLYRISLPNADLVAG